jgi:2-desacetyl-2-hydroxyethyl bacteriochlorophyllide A dehydrogenase
VTETAAVGRMWASRLHAVGQPLVLEQVPVPVPGPGQVLVRIRATGLCGSDVHIAVEGTTPTGISPIILGHEPAGVVVETGEGVEGWEPGARVAVVCLLSCGSCPRCRAGRSSICERRVLIGIHIDGGLAEYLVAPQESLARLPDAVPFEIGAIITDAVATPFHALQDRAQLRAGESIVVVGVGGLGQHAVQIARLMGASIIVAVDVRHAALEHASALGATHVVDAGSPGVVDEVMAATGGTGADVTAEFVGQSTSIETAIACVKPGGRVVVAGIGASAMAMPSPTAFVRAEITLLGSYGFTMASIEQVVQLVAAGRLDLSPSISHRYSLADANEALVTLHTKRGNPTRVVVVQDDHNRDGE